jgi:hypothetical protein
VRGSLPEIAPCCQGSRVRPRVPSRVGSGVTITAKNDKTATVLWLRFTGTSTVAPKADKPDNKDENGKR